MTRYQHFSSELRRRFGVKRTKRCGSASVESRGGRAEALSESAAIDDYRRRRPMSARSLPALIVAVAAAVGVLAPVAPRAHAVPDPVIDYLYNVGFRRRYNFASSDDAVRYGYAVCDKVNRGVGYPQIMSEARNDLASDESDANYLVGSAVSILCPEQIYQLRKSAAGYKPPEDYYVGPPAGP